MCYTAINTRSKLRATTSEARLREFANISKPYHHFRVVHVEVLAIPAKRDSHRILCCTCGANRLPHRHDLTHFSIIVSGGVEQCDVALVVRAVKIHGRYGQLEAKRERERTKNLWRCCRRCSGFFKKTRVLQSRQTTAGRVMKERFEISE